jgi:cytochrome c biogenesis protein CcmG/thiol:disulfide interchange protein DsbE
MQSAMKATRLAACTIFAVLASGSGAADRFPLLHAGDDSYTNVTVTTVTPTDLYFSHAGGMGNVKLKDLDAALQKHFKYDPTNAANIAKAQAEATKQFYMAKAAEKPPVIAPEPAQPEEKAVETPPTNRPPGLRLETVNAKRFLGETAPQLLVEKWLSPQPQTPGKFMLIDFWATWCEECRTAIPNLNALQEKFRDRLVVVGLTDESDSAVQLMRSPTLSYAVAIDTQARTKREVQVTRIPHSMLVDPQGIVRFEGSSLVLTEEVLKKLLDTYAD